MRQWDQFVSEIEKSIGKEAANKWLKTLQVESFDAANIYLKAVDPFHTSWFEQHIRPLLKQLRNNNGRLIKVHLGGKKLAKPWMPILDLSGSAMDPRQTLDSFFPGVINQAAFKVLTSEHRFNPIYIHGPKGSGKTHLLAALAKTHPGSFYVTADRFTEHVVHAMRTGSMQEFRSLYRSQTLLLIDDVDLLRGRSATQEEFFHTFNALHGEKKQIIMTARDIPTKLEEIAPRLTSRFEWGLVLPLAPLKNTDLSSFLDFHAGRFDVTLSPDEKKFILGHFDSAGDICKAIEALSLKDHLSAPLSFQEALTPLLRENQKRRITPDQIIAAVAEEFQLKTDDVLGKSQTKECSEARKVAIFLIRSHLKFSYPALAKIFRRDHSTMIASVQSIEKNLLFYKNHLLKIEQNF